MGIFGGELDADTTLSVSVSVSKNNRIIFLFMISFRWYKKHGVHSDNRDDSC